MNWTQSEEWQSYQRGAPSNIICILRSKLSPLSKFSALRWLKLKFYFTTNFSIDGILNRFRFQSQWTFRTIWSFGNQFQTYLFWFLSKENWIKEGWLFVVIDINDTARFFMIWQLIITILQSSCYQFIVRIPLIVHRHSKLNHG